MKHAITPLFLLVLLAGIILVSGCTGGLDPQALATSNSMIQQFLKEHPNAKIVLTHFTANQSKNIIDQIRSDCDNPYLDEKEFYRVNVTDPDTNFYAIVWIDWESKTIECVFKIGTEGKTVEKPKPIGNCTNHAYFKCYKSHIYWFDSCGNVQDKKEYCQYGCSDTKTGQLCRGECKSQAEFRCYGDHVYWFDSCGNKQEKKEYCDYGCENGFCKSKPYEKTCEQAGGYCIYPQGYCGNGICESGEMNTCTECPAGDATCQSSCIEGTCPQDCMTITPPIIPPSGGGGGGGVSEEAQSGCENKCTASNIKFADFWADKETYSTGEVIRFFAKLTDNNGNPAIPEQGNKVYLFAVSPTTGSSGSSAPANYNYTSGYYESTTPPIPTSNVEPGTWIFFATAENSESFAISEDVYVKINPTASTALPTANPAPYEGCTTRCLMRFRMAEPLKPVMQPSPVHISTGMIIATEVTATSTQITYQCKDGYEIGKYFCKEGGVCCIPKTTPPLPTEFCGSSTQGSCSTDSDCIRSGCSSQICQSVQENQQPVTTCEYKDCYNAEKYGMACRCESGACKWTSAKQPTNYYHNAYWQCYDGKESSEGGETSCKPTEVWRKYAENFCAGRCNTQTATSASEIKCGVNTFRVWNECSSCTDSDGGKNYYSQGTATAYGQSLTDHCNDAYSLTEKYCSGDQISAEVYQCPYGCKDGACMEAAQACTDSDGGQDYYVKGAASGYYNGQYTTMEDFCSKENVLYEFYCSGNEIIKNYFTCPYGCQDGACIQQTLSCTETDNGMDYYNTGVTTGIPEGYNSVVTGLQTIWTDNCATNTILAEYYCSENRAKQTSYQCPNGCSDGACMQQSCPARIDVSFSKASYYPGDNASFSIAVYDSSGNPIPNYNVMIELESDGQKQNGATSTGPNGIFFSYGIISNPEGKTHTLTYRVSTNTSGCPPLSDTEMITIYAAPNQCTDSDGGKNYYVKGTMWAFNVYDQYMKSEDYCLNYQGKTYLVEYSCSSDGRNGTDEWYECPYGCSEGVCIQQPPTQSSFSEGFESYTAGQAPPSPWMTLDFSGKVAEQVAHSGGKSLLLSGGPYNSQSAVVDMGTSYPDSLSYEVYLKISSSGSGTFVGFLDQVGNMAPMFNCVYFNGYDGKIHFYSADQNNPIDVVLAQNFSSGVWHKLHVDLDFQALKANVYLDDALIGNAVAMSPRNVVAYNGAGLVLRKVGMIHYTGSGIYFDDFSVSQPLP